MNRGIVVIVFAIIANLVLATALINSSWNPLIVAALVMTVFTIVALCYFYHQSVIDAAGRGCTWCHTNRTGIAKTLLVAVLIASTLWVIWLLAVKAAASRPVTTPVVVPAAVAPAPGVTPVTPAPASPTPATPSAPVATPMPAETRVVMVFRTDRPYRLSVPPGHRWDLVEGAPLFGWTTDSGSRDEHGNRIQIFETVFPVQEIALPVRVSRCMTPQSCAW